MVGDLVVEEERRVGRNGLHLSSRQEVSQLTVGGVDFPRRLRDTLLQHPHLPWIRWRVDRGHQRGNRTCRPP
jgi:hypothetical protein